MNKMRPTSEMKFEEKISICLKDLPSFSLSCTEIHEASGCYLEPLLNVSATSFFYLLKKKTTPPGKGFLLDICKKWPISFDEMFTVVRYKKFCLDYF